MLLAAPAAQGLFAVAGMESNVIPGGQLPSFSSVETADQGFVAAVGCLSAADVLACLRAVPADTIVNLGFSWPGGPGIGSTFLPRGFLRGFTAEWIPGTANDRVHERRVGRRER